MNFNLHMSLLHIFETLDLQSIRNVHCINNAENPCFEGFLIHTFSITDKVVKYGRNNQFDFSEQPKVVQRGEKRIINIYAVVPDVV